MAEEKKANSDYEVEKDIATPVVAPSTSESRWGRIFDSFKQGESQFEGLDGLTDAERINVISAKSPLHQKLKNRHLQMIAIGGSIGTGLFVGSGNSLAGGGPAGVIIAYCIIGCFMFTTMQALGELAVAFPVSGAFSVYNSKFVCPAWGFTMAWNYAMQWLVVLPLELVTASIVISYWNKEINGAAWVSIFWVFISAINIFGVKGYGEAEFIFAIVKIVAIVGYCILGIILAAGGGPNHEYIGGRYYQHPGAFNHGFKGVCSVFVTAAFAFAGTELAALAAAETENPRKSLPKACKQVFWRICLFYIVSLTLVGLLVPYTDDRLGGASNAAASPFVISIVNAGIHGLPSLFNVVILISVLSVGNSSTYGCTRTLVSMAEQGFAPKIFGYIDRAGRPLVALGISLTFGLLCFLAASSKHGAVFNWMLALSGLSSIFTWASACACHVIFRLALKAQGRSTDELSFTAPTGIYGSIFGVVGYCLVLMAQFWVGAWPISSTPVSPSDAASSFFQAYLAAPVVIVFYVFYMCWKRDFTFFNGLKNIDLDTGRRIVDIELLKQEIAEEKAYLASKPMWYRAYNFWC